MVGLGLDLYVVPDCGAGIVPLSLMSMKLGHQALFLMVQVLDALG